MTETNSSKKIVDWLNGLDDTYAYKHAGTVYGSSGQPDIQGCIRGRSFVIENKSVGNKPTRLQSEKLEKWAAAGALAFWCVGLDAVQRMMIQFGWVRRDGNGWKVIIGDNSADEGDTRTG